MNPYKAAEQFLQAVFPDHAKHAIFANALYNLVTKKLGTWEHFRDVKQLDSTRDCFMSAAGFPDDGMAERTGARATDVRALVIDDVGGRVPSADVLRGLGKPPTFEVLTSTGNAHWWYLLTKPVPATQWRAFFAEVERRIGHELDGQEPHHLFRLPMGVNTKAKRNGFKPCFGQTDPEVRLDADAIMLFAEPAPASASSDGGGCYSYRDMMWLASLLPNPDSLLRKAWVDKGYQFKALAIDDEAAWQAFDAWSRKNTKWYDGDDTEKLWRGLKPRFSGRELLVEIEALDGEGYQAWITREAQAAFDDDEQPPPEIKRKGITATPYEWVDPDKIPLRDWLYGDILLRKFISMTVAPGGVGKSSLIAVETLAQVTGQALLGTKPPAPLRVWLWNLEDPREETTRKIQAAALHYRVTEADIGSRLFVDSGREQRLVIAQPGHNGGAMIVRPAIKELVEQIKLRGIDVVVVDPFVSCHEVEENDNTAQDMVVKEWGRVAEEGNCAVHLIDHTSKAGSQEVVTDSSRGAKAKTDAARIVRVINRMSRDEGEKIFGIKEPWRYFHTFNDKANMAPPAAARDWFHLESVGLGNGSAAAAFSVGAGAVAGDYIGVVERWVPPSPQDLVTGDSFKAMVEAMGTEDWRSDVQAGEKWIGNAAAKALNLDPKQPKDRQAIKDVVMQWLKAGILKEVMQQDKNRNMRKFIKISGGF